MSLPLFYAAAVASAAAGDSVVLDGPEGHHAARVRRLRVGEHVDLGDGRGTVASGVVTSVAGSTVAVSVASVREVPGPSPRVVVVQALAKGERGELAVELMTEVGVDEIVPWQAARCVVVWNADRAARGVSRWRAHAHEAAKQARRAWVPEVSEVASTADVAARVGRAALAVVLHESGEAGSSLPPDGFPAQGDVVLVVGPEGGLTDEEVAEFVTAGARVCRLGATVLRASTAGAVGATVVLAATRWA